MGNEATNNKNVKVYFLYPRSANYSMYVPVKLFSFLTLDLAFKVFYPLFQALTAYFDFILKDLPAFQDNSYSFALMLFFLGCFPDEALN